MHSIALRCINLTDGMKEQAHRAATLKLCVEKAPSPTQGHASWALCLPSVCVWMAGIMHHFSKHSSGQTGSFSKGITTSHELSYMHTASHSSQHHQASLYVFWVGEVCVRTVCNSQGLLRCL